MILIKKVSPLTALKGVQTNLKRYRAVVLKAACEGWPAQADQSLKIMIEDSPEGIIGK